MMDKDGKSAPSINKKVNLLNEFFQFVYSPEKDFKAKEIQPENPNLTNFSITQDEIYQILIELDVTKSRNSNGYPLVFYQKTAKKK